MRTADTNDDGRIDFNEFAQRFEVIFSKMRQAPPSASPVSTAPPSPGPPPSPITMDDSPDAFAPNPAADINVETMDALLKIGKALFALDGSLQEHFSRFDLNKDGVLQRDEFEQALVQLGFSFSDERIAHLMAAVDTDAGNSIDYNEFVTAFGIQDVKESDALAKGDVTWQNAVLQQVSNVFYQHRIHIRNAFRMFDPSNSGVISKESFRAGITTFNVVLNSPLSDDQIEELLVYLDSDQDGVISYKEFFDGFRVVDVRITDEE